MPKLRVEFLAVGGGRGRLGGQIAVAEAAALGASVLDVTGTASAPVPVPAGGGGQVFAELTAAGGSVYVAVGPEPNPGLEPRLLVAPGRARLVRVLAGQVLVAIAAADMPGQDAAGGAVELASPTVSAGERIPLSLNSHAALRVIRQKADGSDVDETAPRETVPARSGTITVAQLPVPNTAPASPALPANTGRKHARLTYRTGGANVYWAPTAALATATLGALVPPGTAFDLPPGYTGDVFLIADAAGPTAVSLSQLA